MSTTTMHLDTEDADANLILMIQNQKSNPRYQYELVSVQEHLFEQQRGYLVTIRQLPDAADGTAHS